MKELLLDQFLANANDHSWYLSYQEVVEDVDEGLAFQKPNQTSHSIAELTQHLIYWNTIWQQRYRNGDVNQVSSVEDNKESFKVDGQITFSKLKQNLLTILLDWQELLKDSARLNSPVNGFPVEAQWWMVMANATTHNAYHIGQIAYIKKMYSK
ncbi:DinB superfamily protein [Amphibacillus marinus]|uniref:DinB superfamily protein n=1 Tax=Amphibacillus marinus TaxID=872970 RepID=A0A1H8KD13_9BACI|nr:DinB family protein [Amphibacillus marinus]SEN90308.1 DinB superfamily protein [Amphibacillus marinus]